MKASELIEKLQAQMAQFGDLEVKIWTLKRFYSAETGGIKKALFPKVGAWVWWKGASDIGYAPGYMKITDISNEIIDCDAIQGIPIAQNQISEARLRPWTKEEMAEKAGKVFDLPEGRCVCIRCDGYCCYFMDRCESEDDTAHIIAYTADTFLQYDCKLDNSPCGVLEHREGDGWVR